MVDLVCQKCSHEWNYRGEMNDYATCPSCKTSVALPRPNTQSGSTTSETEIEADVEDRLDRIEGKLDRLTEVIQKKHYDKTEEKTPETEVNETDHEDGDDSFPYDPTEEF